MSELSRIGRVKSWYETNESRLSSASLLLGFVFDSLTLNGIDNLRDNVWIAMNLVAVALCIIFLNRNESGGKDTVRKVRTHFWLSTIVQFGFGAILGAFFIFYFRSATFVAAWPFLLLILGALVANELFQKKYARLTLQVSFLYLSIFSFSIFLVPVLVHQIGPWVFLASGVVSLIVVWLYAELLRQFARRNFTESQTYIRRSVLAVFLLINVLYFTNLIPPVPLSLKDADIYHSIVRTNEGYRVTEEEHGIWGYFHLRERFHTSLGSTAYAYSAIYSPASFNTKVVHEWQYHKDGEWVTTSRITLPVSGGRGNGFRTFSEKTNLKEGKWRVNVSTPQGQLIGRINFKVISTDGKVPLEQSFKE